MSSEYRLICLSHDPGIVVDSGEYPTAEAATATLDREPGPAAGHVKCDLALGRYSYPLIEVACLCRRPAVQCLHRDPAWTRAGWLRLLWHSRQNDDATERLVGSDAYCWPVARLDRLAPLLMEDS